MTIKLPPEIEAQVGRRADATHRMHSLLAAEAISKFSSSETKIIERIEHGLADMGANRLVPHDAAMARLEATIAAVERRKR